MLIGASVAYADTAEEQLCRKGGYSAAAKYAQCELKAVGRYGSVTENLQRQLSNCRIKYTATWEKLQSKWLGTACDTGRFVAGDGVVFDNLTGLEWEQKDNLDGMQDLANPHDADNRYTWSEGDLSSTAADGTIYTDFLELLNNHSSPMGCFEGQCDWRLPTRAELQTILAEPYPCTTSPCIDPIFGPTAALFYYSSTSTRVSSPVAWEVLFGNGNVDGIAKSIAFHVRAVRGGL